MAYNRIDFTKIKKGGVAIADLLFRLSPSNARAKKRINFDFQTNAWYKKSMTQATITKKINKTADEMQLLIRQSKRKLLEFEVMMSMAEIKAGKFEAVRNVRDFFKKLK